MIKRYLLTALALLINTEASLIFADGFSIHLQGGASISTISANDTVWLNSSVANDYELAGGTTTTVYYGGGVSYQWDKIFARFAPIAFNLGLNSYFLNYSLQGTNYPFINAGSFDTLNFNAHDRSIAIMLEPKFIYTAFKWQPYLLTGIGVASNRVSNYSETPTDPNGSASPTTTPFQNKTDTNCAYAIGLGVQHLLYTNAKGNRLTLGVEYRYMNWGKLGLAPAATQATTQPLNLGTLQTNLIGANLIWEF